MHGLKDRRPDAQRGIAVATQVVDAGAKLTQAIHQVSNRPLVHTINASKDNIARRLRHDHRRQKSSNGEPRIANKKFKVLGLRKLACHTFNGEALTPGIRQIAGQPHAQAPQAFDHHPGVVGVKQARNLGRAVGKGCKQQGPVGKAFTARKFNPTPSQWAQVES